MQKSMKSDILTGKNKRCKRIKEKKDGLKGT